MELLPYICVNKGGDVPPAYITGEQPQNTINMDKSIKTQVASLQAQFVKVGALVAKRGAATLKVQVRRAGLVAKGEQLWKDSKEAYKAAGVSKAEYIEQFGGMSSTGWSRALAIHTGHTEDNFNAYVEHCTNGCSNPSEKGYHTFLKGGNDEGEGEATDKPKYVTITHGGTGDKQRIPVRELTPEQIEALALFGVLHAK